MKNLFVLIFFIFIAACTSKPVRKPAEPVEVIPVDVAGPVFTYKSSLEWVAELAEKANCTIAKEEFKDALKATRDFTLDPTNSTGVAVLKSLESGSCMISTYRTKNPWSKAIATTWATDREKFYLNLRRNPRAMGSMINTAVHECLHLLGYSHGSNSSAGKQNTVNYKVGKLAEIYACD